MLGLPLVLIVALIGAAIIAFATSGVTLRRRSRTLRAIAIVIDIAFLAIAVVLLAEIAGGDGPFGYLLLGALATGSLLHIFGVSTWYGRAAWLFRLGGFAFMLPALLVPGFLNLALPLAGALVPTLRESPASQGAKPIRHEGMLFSIGAMSIAVLCFAAPGVSASGTQLTRFKGVRAITGDTMVAVASSGSRSRIRLIGIRAPGLKACFASQARSALHHAIAGRRLTVQSDRRAKRSYVTRGRMDVGERLVSLGFVRVDPFQRFAREARYRRLEREARQRARGLWRACSLPGRADLTIDQLDSEDPVRVGADLTYTLRVTNLGPATATKVVVTDELPKSLDPNRRGIRINAVGRCWLDTASWRAECSFDRLAPQNSIEIELTVRPGSIGQMANSATVAAATSDPDRSSNTAVEQTTVTD